MRIIAFITHSADIGHILEHIGAQTKPPRITPARGPPLWDDCDAQVDDGMQSEPECDLAAQPAPDDEVDQRVNWLLSETAIWTRCGSITYFGGSNFANRAVF